jgi:hypothetical protein
MAVNYATKYADAALDQFKVGSYTAGVFGAKYDWTGAKTVAVFSNATASMNDYVRTGTARYGTMENLGNTVDTLEVDQERSFIGAIDGLDEMDTNGTLNAGSFLRQQINRVITPDIDSYAFDAIFDACPTAQISASAVMTSANAYTAFLTGNLALTNDLVPLSGRVAFVTGTFNNLLKLDSSYVKASDLAQRDIAYNGMVGMVDGVPIIMVPDGIMNGSGYNGGDNHVDFMIVHQDAIALPVKLADYTVLPKGTVANVFGDVVQGLVVYDCFVLDALNDGIYIHKHA